MATQTIEVSTMTELKAAYTANTYGDDDTITIKLTTDIDCNDDFPLGIGYFCNDTSHYPNIIIDGEKQDGTNYVIRNIRALISSPDTIIGFMGASFGSGYSQHSTSLKLKNIDFINLDVDYGLLFFRGDASAEIEGCRFVGKRKDYLFIKRNSAYEYLRSFKISKSFFNVPYTPKSNPNRDKIPYVQSPEAVFPEPNAEFCRFKETILSTDVYSGHANTPCSIENFKLSGCYVYGDIATSVGYLDLDYNISAYTPNVQNVIDCTTYIANTSAGEGDTVSLGSVSFPPGVYKKDFRKFGDPTIHYTGSASSVAAGCILESIENMANAQQLYTDGFDVVVPPTT